MQTAKDTFYAALRDRMAAQFPGRTAAIRGLVRPAVMVEENELVTGDSPLETFVLRWTGRSVEGSSDVEMLTCEIRYATEGSQELAGVDRGRRLSELDAELTQVLEPRVTAEKNFAISPPEVTGANVFWSEPAFEDSATDADRLERVVKVSVMSSSAAVEE
ncbi:HYR domain-containing protein [Terriglobus tenax]|uniref:HYR domain-containing protein n=1 Tax=Terriglobus tenax TaxID=1111115 RepID=UPI0021E05023|nr:HYR domain-containing protein [Terriglobus tenax]